MSRPKKYHISLTEAERNRLKKLAKSAESKKLIRKRINILLNLDESQGKYLTYEQCVKANATSMMNVYKVIIAYAKGELVDSSPDVEKILLVMDNLNTHAIASLYKRFTPKEAKRIKERLEIRYTPKHGSWLDMTEIELNVMTRQCLNMRIDDIDKVRAELKEWEAMQNNAKRKIKWQFTTDDARVKLVSLYPIVEENLNTSHWDATLVIQLSLNSAIHLPIYKLFIAELFNYS